MCLESKSKLFTKRKFHVNVNQVKNDSRALNLVNLDPVNHKIAQPYSFLQTLFLIKKIRHFILWVSKILLFSFRYFWPPKFNVGFTHEHWLGFWNILFLSLSLSPLSKFPFIINEDLVLNYPHNYFHIATFVDQKSWCLVPRSWRSTWLEELVNGLLI